jgi:hypothetical protein
VLLPVQADAGRRTVVSQALEGFDGVLLLPAQGVPARVALLNDVLSVGQRDRAGAPAPAWPGSG